MSRLLVKDNFITFIKGLRPVPVALLQQIEKDYDSTVKELWKISKEEWERLCKYRGVQLFDYLYPISDNMIDGLVQLFDDGTLADVLYGVVNKTYGYFNREKLLEKLMGMVARNKHVCISPGGIVGKSTLLVMFMETCLKDSNVSYVNCLSGGTFGTLLLNVGIDLKAQTYDNPFQDDKPHILILDDAQMIYKEADDWNLLIKVMLPKIDNMKLIISARYSFEIGDPNLAELRPAEGFNSNDFILTEEESHAFVSDVRFGLKEKMNKHSSLRNLIVNESGGQIGVLKQCCMALSVHLRKNLKPTETEALQYYLSRYMNSAMSICFGGMPPRPKSEKLVNFLREAYFGDKEMAIKELDTEGQKEVAPLLIHGILSENSGIVKYSSRMARRCYRNTIFDRLQ